jgi:hypothetical protein
MPGGSKPCTRASTRSTIAGIRPEPVGDALHGLGQVARLVDGIDEKSAHEPLQRILGRHFELKDEMVVQADIGREGRLEIGVLAVEAARSYPGPRARRERERLATPRLGTLRGAALRGEHVVEAGVEIALDLPHVRAHLRGHPALGLGRLEAVAAVRLVTIGTGHIVLDALQQRVALQLGVHVGHEIEVRELQQLDRLQKLRRHDQGLTLAYLKPLRQAHRSNAPRQAPGASGMLFA